MNHPHDRKSKSLSQHSDSHSATRNGRRSAAQHCYNALDFLEDDDDDSTDSCEEEAAAEKQNDLTLRAPVPNFRMLLSLETTSTRTLNHQPKEKRDLAVTIARDHHDECLRPFISALLVSCRILRLSMETTFTAACLLHRIAISHPTLKTHNPHDQQKDDRSSSDKNENDWRWVIASCIFLACKVEEEPRRLRDLINMAHMISFHDDANNNNQDDEMHYSAERNHSKPDSRRQNSKNHNSCSNHAPPPPQQVDARAALPNDDKDNDDTSSPVVSLYWKSEPPDLDRRYWQAKETLVKAEQNVLRWLAFDVAVSHPHRAVVILLFQLQLDSSSSNTAITHQDYEDNSKQTATTTTQQQRTYPADAATGTLMMQVQQEKSNTHAQQQEHYKNNHHHLDLTQQAWTFLNNAVFYVEALQHGVLALATAALEMAQEEQQQRRQAQEEEDISGEATKTASSASTTHAHDNHISTTQTRDNSEVAHRPSKKLKSKKTTGKTTTITLSHVSSREQVASARQSLHEALTRVQRLSQQNVKT